MSPNTLSPNTLSPKQRREPQTLRHLLLRNEVIRAFWLIDDEFFNLNTHSQQTNLPRREKETTYIYLSIRNRTL